MTEALCSSLAEVVKKSSEFEKNNQLLTKGGTYPRPFLSFWHFLTIINTDWCVWTDCIVFYV